jgi:iron complex outermembrane recepter protein
MYQRTKICSAVMAVLGGTLAFGIAPAVAQDAPAQRVEITGSSIKRVDAETSLPVTIIKVEELTRQGVTTAEQAMQRLASNQSNFGVSQAIGGTTGAKAEADLRGLSGPAGTNANKTLVLLNGRRIANHAFDAAAVDLNSIPLAAVDRIEVLRDGASAVYGTDAIGGVINFILKRDFTGLELSAQTQQPERRDGGDTNRVTVVGGFGSLSENNFNLLASVDWRKQRPLEAAKREFAKTGVLGSTTADLTAGTSGTAFPGDVNGFEPTAPNCSPPASLPRVNPDGSVSCRYDFTRDIDIIPKNEQITGVLRGTFALGADHTLTAEYLHANNKAVSRVAAAPNSHVILTSSPFWPTGAPISTNEDGTDVDWDPDTPGVQTGGVVNWRQVPAGKRTSGDNTTTQRAMVELQGSFAGFDYRTALGQSKNKSTASVIRGYVDDDLIQQGIFDNLINPFGDQTAAGTAAIEAAQVNAPTQIGTNTVEFFDMRFSKDLAQLPAGALSAAWGFEHRREKSGFEATDVTGRLSSLGIDPDSDTSGSRKVSAVFAEFNIPVLKSLEFNVAGRYDKYSDFGSTFNPKVGVRFQPMPQLLFRGSANKGFRAPTLYEIYQPASLTFTTDNYDDPLLCPGGSAVPGASAGVVCGQQVLQQNAGPAGLGQSASTLQPEKSKTFTLGLVIEPTRDLSFGVDLWQIQVDNLISGLPEQAIFGNPTKYADRFVRCSALSAEERATIDTCLNTGFDPIAYIRAPNENLGTLKTNGIDLSANWRSPAMGLGRIGVSFEGTYVNKYVYQREVAGEFISAVGRYSDNAPVFRWQHVLSVNWSSGPWAATLAQRYKTGYTDYGGAEKVGDYLIHDLSGTWTGVKNLSVTLAVNNLLDQDPPRSVQTTTFQRGYDPRFSDPLGRTYMLRVGYKFF